MAYYLLTSRYPPSVTALFPVTTWLINLMGTSRFDK